MIINASEIAQILPHRYPFLLVDRILELKEHEFIKAIKNVTFNEHYFTGHFPSNPVMPGVLIIEALAQVSGILAAKTMNTDCSSVYLVGIDQAKFRKIVSPGDTLVLESKISQKRDKMWKFETRAMLDEKTVTSALISAMTE